jgi:hypothetical protein
MSPPGWNLSNLPPDGKMNSRFLRRGGIMYGGVRLVEDLVDFQRNDYVKNKPD